MNRGISELNNIELRLINTLEITSEGVVSNNMEKIYKECCIIEKLDYSQGYGFGEEGIREYIIATILLDLIEEDESKYIIGSIRLLVKGYYGSLNYANLTQYISEEKLNISLDTWNKSLEKVNKNFSNLLKSELANRKTKGFVTVDLENCVDIIEKMGDYKPQEVEPIENQIYVADDKKKYVEVKNRKNMLIVVIALLALCALLLNINSLENNKGALTSNENLSETTSNTNENSDEKENTNKTEDINKTDASKDTNNADSSNTDDIKNTSNINEDENNNSSYIVKENQPNDPSLKYYEKVNYDTATKYYCLYSQAFIYEDKAIAAWEKIKEQNIASTVLKEDNSYKIRIGSDYNLKDAKKIREELNEKSIYTYVLAYDKDVEKEIEELKQLINDNKIKEYKERYVKLRNEIKSKSTYDRYVDQIDFIYRNAQ